jgi:hypothetical protein
MNKDMNISEMSVVEYVDYLESMALYCDVSAFDLNMEYHMEIGVVDMEMYERAKAELLERRRYS